MDTLSISSLVASLVSVALAIVAIWLSVVFYRLSSTLSESTKEAAKGIESSVDRLEKLFDKLYSDTFSMMRDTVSDMRKHMWPEEMGTDTKVSEEAEKKADQKVEQLKAELGSEVAKLLERQKITDAKLSSVTQEMRDIVDRAIRVSRRAEVEAREETVREVILRRLRILRRRKPVFVAQELLSALEPEVPPSILIRQLERLRTEGVVSWDGDEMGPDTVIRLIG